ncbi:MAG: DNA polymerase III subunit gamma/tau [Gemmataceae bacterium]|nr:DNA polymerase III subunit gamma/tau [Gemmataceae bacterium]
MAKRKSPSPENASESGREYTVLARRYRPQQFADLVGQEPVAQALTNALQSGRVAHAYLFTGARGVGKTSTARILAKALNCVNGPTTTPCDNCESCIAVASGDDIDVIEIDGASNRRIEEIREIRGNVQYRPSRGRYKIYIIDEVHMLTKEAFNALLKTLEEPPEHVKFIFATTEASKIPITILSRCQRFDFAGIGMKGIVARLKEIVAAEGMKADDEALEFVARRAGGSMRDAQSLLDQLMAFGSDKLTAEQVHQLLGTANEDRIAGLAKAALARDANAALALLADASDQGIQLGELLDQLIEYWRDLLVVHSAGADQEILSVTGKHREELKRQAQSMSADTILAGMDVLVASKSRMRTSTHPRVLLEMALVRLCRLEELVALSQLAQWVAQNGASVPLASRSLAATPAVAAEKKNLSPEQSPAAPLSFGSENLTAIWNQLLEQSGLMLSRELAKAKEVAISGPNTLVLRIAKGYNQQIDNYLDSTRIKRVEELLTKITSQPCSVRLEWLATPVETNGSAPAPASTPAESPMARVRKQRVEAGKLPLVGRAMELLGGQVLQMDEAFGQQSMSEVELETGAEESTEEG